MAVKNYYYAFISYSHIDKEYAEWLHERFEKYHLPSSIIEKKPDLPQEYSPVFLDNKELSSGRLEKELYQALENSTWLVVLCSPASAISDYVDPEIRHFIESHKNRKDRNGNSQTRENRIEHIVPVIVSGIPYSNNEEQCFPKKLIELKEDEGIDLLAIDGKRQMLTQNDINEDGWEKSFIRILSYMLEIPFDELWDRRTREIEEERRKLKEQNDRLYIAQSRFVAEKAEELIKKGDSFLARYLAIKVLPNNENPDRPIVAEAERLLRKSLERNNAILRGHTHSAMASVFSKDGSKIYSIALDGYLCVWNATNGELLFREKRHTRGGTSICISPDGKSITTASYDKTVLIWNAETYKNKSTPLVHSDPVLQTVYSSDGQYIINGLTNGHIWIWTKQGEFVTEFKDNENQGITVLGLSSNFTEIFGLSINKENRIFASTWESLNFWDFNNETISYAGKIDLPIGRPHSMVFSSDGRYMVSSNNNNLYIWDLLSYNKDTQTYQMITEKPLPHKGDIHAIDISRDSKHIAVGADNNLYIWECDFKRDVSEWKSIEIKFDAIIDHISYHPKKEAIAASFNRSEVKIIDLSKTYGLAIMHIAADSLDFSPTGESFAVVSEDNYAPTVFNVKNCRATVIPQYGSVMNNLFPEHNNNVVFHEDGETIYSLSDYGIMIWDSFNVNIYKNELNVYLSNHSCCFKTVSRNGQRAVFAYKNGSLFLINAQNGNVIRLLEDSVQYTLKRVASFSYDSKYLVTTSKNGDAKIWNANTGDLYCEFPTQAVYWGNSIEFSRDCTLIISASQEGIVYLWKWETGTDHVEILPSLIGHNEKVSHASFSMDGTLAVSSSNNKIIVWDVQTGIVLKEIICHCDKRFVRFSPDSKKVFSSNGKFLFIWDYLSIKELIEDTQIRFGSRKLTIEECRQYYLE